MFLSVICLLTGSLLGATAVDDEPAKKLPDERAGGKTLSHAARYGR
jgi:hypothetical protein